MTAPDSTASITAAVAASRDSLVELSRRIHDHPELRFQEDKAAAWLTAAVEAAGVAVERNLAGMATAFRASIGPKGGARVAILAEYDALPEIGHACGHNLIATGALGAFLALARRADSLTGEVTLLGTPAEEGGGGKIKLIEAGAFAGLDAAIMFHPYDRDVLALPALASEWITFSFKGSPSHASAAPWDGNSALTAVIQTFGLIDSLRVHFRDGSRVHGFITNGGQAVNIIPEHAACQFSVRATTASYLPRLAERVIDCARAAAMATRTELSVNRQLGYKDMRNNLTLARAFGRHLESTGRQAVETDPEVGVGSTDMGDVSHVVPAIHPYLAVCDKGASMCHQHDFARFTRSDRGMDAMLAAARAMAATAEQVLTDGDLRAAAKREFEAR
ncbi:MAG: amidohydrolase [Deltaproteobacteria bacterium]|nr:amidohydrolase [Deltaproteobacteria bacterium]